MNKREKIALLFCLFIMLSPIMGSFFSADGTLGKIAGNFMPLLHLTMSQLGGPPFGQLMGWAIGLTVLFVGIIGFLILFVTRFRNVNGLIFLLCSTMLYQICRGAFAIAIHILSFHDLQMKQELFLVLAVIFDFLWGFFCYWCSTVLASESWFSKRINKSTIA
jgi:hypothetical protein